VRIGGRARPRWFTPLADEEQRDRHLALVVHVDEATLVEAAGADLA
jgi:hypothetical protein